MTSIRNKDLVTRKRLSTSVDKDILKESKKISDDTKIPFSKLMDEALNDLIIKYREKKTRIQTSLFLYCITRQYFLVEKTLGQNKSMRKLYNIPLLFPFLF